MASSWALIGSDEDHGMHIGLGVCLRLQDGQEAPKGHWRIVRIPVSKSDAGLTQLLTIIPSSLIQLHDMARVLSRARDRVEIVRLVVGTP